jgi:hypothetical protein
MPTKLWVKTSIRISSVELYSTLKMEVSMSPKIKFFIILSIMLLAVSACDFLPSPDTGSDTALEDSISTSVAATIAAEESAPMVTEAVEPDTSPELEVTGVPELAPTDTPEPLILTILTLRVTYVKDGNVYYWEEGAAPLMLTSAGDATDARISDDGAVIAFTRGPDWYHQELWAINSDGSNLRLLVDQATMDSYVTNPNAVSARAYSFAFKPATHQVAFNTQLTFEGPGLFINDDIRIVDADTTALSTIMAPGTAGNFFYSPDGTKIGISTASQVSVVNADGSGRIDLLAFPVTITYSEYQYYPPLSWTPDGTAIRVIVPPEDPLAATPQQTRIWNLPADGSPPTNTMSMITVAFPLTSSQLSGNTDRVGYLFTVTPGAPPIYDLHISNVDGSGDVTYATGPLGFYGIAADGGYFIYTDADPNPKIGQYGGGSIPLASVTKLINVKWVNNTQFLYQSKNGANFELYLGEVGLPSTFIDSTSSFMIQYSFSY